MTNSNSGSRKNTSLRWVRENGDTVEDREYADKKYDEVILNLWVSYVNHTGDTYYPALQEELYLDFGKYEAENTDK